MARSLPNCLPAAAAEQFNPQRWPSHFAGVPEAERDCRKISAWAPPGFQAMDGLAPVFLPMTRRRHRPPVGRDGRRRPAGPWAALGVKSSWKTKWFPGGRPRPLAARRSAARAPPSTPLRPGPMTQKASRLAAPGGAGICRWPERASLSGHRRRFGGRLGGLKDGPASRTLSDKK
jgi:hypothetical protein